MTIKDSAAGTSPVDQAAVAIHLLLECGYDSTSVDELAEALEVSRSTFFRRFGGKEDIVFADHRFLLARLDEVLNGTDGDAFDAVNSACFMVLRYHVSRPAATLERRRLLKNNPSLRDRELVMSHRYERVFRTFLSAGVAGGVDQGWMSSAYAAGAVAVHNNTLRAWFADNRLDAERHLRTELTAMAETLRSRLDTETMGRPRVVVTVYEPSAPIETVLTDIRRAVEG